MIADPHIPDARVARSRPRSSDAPLSRPITGVAYDARFARAEPSGIGQVCVELLRGLSELPELPTLDVLVGPGTRLPDDVWSRPNLQFRHVPWHPYGLANQVGLPGVLRRLRVRLLHGIDGHNPLGAAGVKIVVNLHDLIPLARTALAPRSKKARFRGLWRSWLWWQCTRASRVVCGSWHAARDIVSRLPVAAGKIDVIANPIREWPTAERPEDLRRRLGLRDRVISYVGRQEPYKNVGALIRAIPTLNRLMGGRPVQLVVAGRFDERYPEARAEADRLGLSGQVLFPGYLSEASLGALYRMSSAFVFPSLLEGFGLPPLEAMRFGVPVVAGRASCLPEVLGGAALYVDCTDPLRLACGIAQVLTEPATAARLRDAGSAHVLQFSRRTAARRYLELYREVLGEPFR